MIKAHSSGRMVSSGTSVVITSLHSEKTRLKKLMMTMMMKIIIIIIIIINIIIMMMMMDKSQETTVFSGRHKLTSAMKLRPVK